MNMLQISL